MSAPRLVIAGNLFVDDLVFADGRTRLGEAGGAVLYAALGASLWSDGIACLSRRGDDYPQAALQNLSARGVDLSGVRVLDGPGGRTWLLYEWTQWRMVPRLATPSHEAVSPTPDELPPSFAAAQAVHLAPMPLACQAALLDGFSPRTFVSLDPHLPVREDTLPHFRPLFERVDALFLAEEELRLEGAAADPRRALRQLCSGRLQAVAWKRGAAGGLLYDARTERLQPWAARAERVVDPTGCGDAFAASFVTAILDGEDTDAAVQRGIVGASFALAGWGASELLATDGGAARARLAEWRRSDCS